MTDDAIVTAQEDGRPWPAHGGEAAALLRAVDWAAVGLPPADAWPQSLRTAVDIVLGSPVPMVLLWGPQGVMVYNDAYAVFAGGRHPASFGARVLLEWPEVAELNARVIEAGLRGEAMSLRGEHLVLHRHGAAEEVWLDLDYGPVRDEAGRPAGVLAVVVDITDRVTAERARDEAEAALIAEREAFKSANRSLSAETGFLRRLFQQAPSFTAVLRGPDHVFEIANEAYLELVGAGRDIIGKPARRALPEVEGQGFFELLDEVWRTGEPFVGKGLELSVQRLPGAAPESLYVDFVYQPINGPAGEVAAIFVEGIDVTPQKRLETELRARNAYFRLLLNSTGEAFYAVDTQGRTTLCNAAFLKMLGFGAEEEVLGRKLHDIVHHTHADGSPHPIEECPIYRCARTGEAAHVDDDVFFRLDGTSFPIEYWAQPIDEAGLLKGAICTFVDVTERRAAEARLRAQEQALREETRALEILNRTGAAVAADTDLESLVQRLTDAGVALTGADYGAFFYNVEDEQGGAYMLYALSGAPREAFAGFSLPRNTAVFGPTFRGEGVVRSDDITHDPRYGRNAPLNGMPEGHLPVRSYLAVPVVSRGGAVIGGLLFGHPQPGMFQDRAERLMTGLAAEASIAIDNARLFQSAEREIAERKRAEAALQALNANLEQRVEEAVAERSKAEEALRQAQKMEAVGQLTGGIAHDFNNLLQGIMGSLNLIQQRIRQGRIGELDRWVTGAMTSAQRAASLTHRLLAFSRRQPLDPRPVNINPLVASMEDLLRRTIGETIRMELVLGGGLWMTLCDPNQLESAVLNLAINARDAMPGGGRLTIETCNAHLDAAVAKQYGVTAGQYVSVCVTDTGTGMAADVMARAFDPFFTTKPTGQGTGLGLSMIYGFIRQSEGHARIYSEVGKGTSVKLYLPRHRGETPAAEQQPEPEPETRGDGEIVLVVEDEAVVRGLITDVLHELGYRALEAADGPAGLEILQSRQRIDLLVTDIGLPGLNGRQMADAARAVRPGLKILFMTGYAENAALANGFLEPGMAMLTKPFAMDALAARIRDMIEA